MPCRGTPQGKGTRGREPSSDADGLGYGDADAEAVEALDFASARGMLWILNSGKKADGSG